MWRCDNLVFAVFYIRCHCHRYNNTAYRARSIITHRYHNITYHVISRRSHITCQFCHIHVVSKYDNHIDDINITWHNNTTKMWSLNSIKIITTSVIIPTIVLKWNNTKLLLVLFNNNNKYFKHHKINIAHKLSICQWNK